MVDLEALSDIERLILIHKVRDPGASQREIARALELNAVTVWKAVNREPLKSAIEEIFVELLEAARATLMGAAHKAARRLENLIDEGDTHHVQRMAARDVLLILQRRGDDKVDEGEEVWEAVIKGKTVQTTKVPRLTAGDEDEGSEN